MSVLSLVLNINVHMIMGFGRLNKDFLRTVVTAHKYIYIYIPLKFTNCCLTELIMSSRETQYRFPEKNDCRFHKNV